jgi:hypothetical protein
MQQFAELGVKNPNTVTHPLNELRIRCASGWWDQPDWGLEILKFLGKTARKISLENFATCSGNWTAWSSVLQLLRHPAWSVTQLAVGGSKHEFDLLSHAAEALVASGDTLSCSIDLATFASVDIPAASIRLLMQLTNGPLIIHAFWCTPRVMRAIDAAYEPDKSKFSGLQLVGHLPLGTSADEAEFAETVIVRISRSMQRLVGRLRWISMQMALGVNLRQAVRMRTLEFMVHVPTDIVGKITQYFSLRDLLNVAQTSKSAHALAQLGVDWAFGFNPSRLKILSAAIPPLHRSECQSLYDYLCGGTPVWADEILAWCKSRNLHHVLPAIQQWYPDLMLQVTMPPVTYKDAQQTNYIFQHANLNLNLRVSLKVDANRLQRDDVASLLHLLQLGCVKTLIVVATGNAVTLKAMDEIGDFIKNRPAGVQPVEELRIDFATGNRRPRGSAAIAADWPMLLLQHFGPTARKVWLNNFAINAAQANFGQGGKWESILVLLSTAHGLQQLTVCGGALEANEFLKGVGSACQQRLALSCNIVLNADPVVNRDGWSPADLMKLTTGVLMIDGRWCGRLVLVEMQAIRRSPEARTRLIYMPRLPMAMPDDIAQLAWEVQLPFSGKAALYVMRVQQEMHEADRTKLLIRIVHLLPDDLAAKIAQFFNFNDMKSLAQTSKATYGLLPGAKL